MRLYRTSQGALLADGEDFHAVGDDLILRLFQSKAGEIEDLLEGEKGMKVGKCDQAELLPPVPDETEVWASGVTYLRSKSARMEESEEAGGDVFYDLVYDAERPELFFKAMGYRAVGSGGLIRVREDSTWDVPEPELTLAINSSGEIFGFAIGNDVSSRSIEGENPLYLPQAKVYTGSCAIGPYLTIGREEVTQAKISRSPGR